MSSHDDKPFEKDKKWHVKMPMKKVKYSNDNWRQCLLKNMVKGAETFTEESNLAYTSVEHVKYVWETSEKKDR